MMPADPHRHLDDETLNAVLDGEASAEERAGVAACADCFARLDRLRLVASALAAPLPAPGADRRRAAIDAALRAAEPASAPPPVLDLRRRRRRMSPAWAAAAAVVAAGALAVPLVDGLAGRGQGSDQAGAARDAAAPSSGEESLADQHAPVAGGELAPAPAASATARNIGEIDLSALDDLVESVEREAEQDQPLTGPGAAPFAEAAPPDARAQPGSDAAAGAGQPCEQAARRRDATLGPLTYAAGATVDGRPAVVLAFEVPPAGAHAIRLLVLAAESCAELGAAPS